MDYEKNNLNIENDEEVFNLDEENKKEQGQETFSAEEEYKAFEENVSNEENEIIKSKADNKDLNNNIKGNSNITNTSSHLSSSLFGVVATAVSSLVILGTAAGVIPTIASNVKVSNFLSRSTELGFEVEKDSSKEYIMNLSGGEYNSSLELNDNNEYIYSELIPNTVYYLVVYDVKEDSKKSVFEANYQTKKEDDYTVSVYNIGMIDNIASFDVDYKGINIEYVTIELLDENSNRFYLYEGEPNKHFDVKIEEEVFSGKISINGKVVFFEEYNIGGGVTPKPSQDDDYMWNWNSHYHFLQSTDPDSEYIELEKGEHEYELDSQEGDMYYYRCKVCGKAYTSMGEWIEGPLFYKCNDDFTANVVTGVDEDMYANSSLEIPSLPDDWYVVEIGEGAFDGTNFTSITMPSTITKIGKNAFSNMMNVTYFSYSGSMADWEAIEKDPEWNSQSSIITISCSDGDVTL